MKILGSILIYLVLGLPALANPCPTGEVSQGLWQFETSKPSKNECFLASFLVQPPPSLQYRSFILTESGHLMVFNSYDSLENSNSTGARVYIFFPRQASPKVQLSLGSAQLSLASPSLHMILGTENPNSVKSSGFTTILDPQVVRTNKGGFEVIAATTLWLDAGFALGQDPTAISGRSSVFHDPTGHTCTVANPRLFMISGDGDSQFRFSDEELLPFLKKTCPGLGVGF